MKSYPKAFLQFIDRISVLEKDIFPNGIELSRIEEIVDIGNDGKRIILNYIYSLLGLNTLILRFGAILYTAHYFHNYLRIDADPVLNKLILNRLKDKNPSDGDWWEIFKSISSRYGDIEKGASYQVDEYLRFWKKKLSEKRNLNFVFNDNNIKEKIEFSWENFTRIRNRYAHLDRNEEFLSIEIYKDIFILKSLSDDVILFEGAEFSQKGEKSEIILRENYNLSYSLNPFVTIKSDDYPIPFLFHTFKSKDSIVRFLDAEEGSIPDNSDESVLKAFEQIQSKGIASDTVFKFDSEIAVYTDLFVGRENEINALKNFILKPQEKRYLPIFAEPGLGKSALLANLISSIDKEKNVKLLKHFCGAGEKNQPFAILNSLLKQDLDLWAKFPEEKKITKGSSLPPNWRDAVQYFQDTIGEWSNLYSGQKMVILIDGVDESLVVSGSSRLDEILKTVSKKIKEDDSEINSEEENKNNELVDWNPWENVRLILGYRSGSFIYESKERFEIELLQPLKPLQKEAIAIAFEKFNLTKQMLDKILELGRPYNSNDDNAIDPSYLRLVYDEISNGKIAIDNLDALPRGIVGNFEKDINKRIYLTEREKAIRFYSILSLFRSGFTLPLLERIFIQNIEDSGLRDWDNYSDYERELIRSEIEEEIYSHTKWFKSVGTGVLSLYHQRLVVFFLQRENKNTIQNYNNIIINNLKQILLEADLNSELYKFAITELPYHFHLSESRNELYSLVFDDTHLQKSLDATGNYFNILEAMNLSLEEELKFIHNSVEVLPGIGHERALNLIKRKGEWAQKSQSDIDIAFEWVKQGNVEKAIQRILSLKELKMQFDTLKLLLWVYVNAGITIEEEKVKLLIDRMETILKEMGTKDEDRWSRDLGYIPDGIFKSILDKLFECNIMNERYFEFFQNRIGDIAKIHQYYYNNSSILKQTNIFDPERSLYEEVFLFSDMAINLLNRDPKQRDQEDIYKLQYLAGGLDKSHNPMINWWGLHYWMYKKSDPLKEEGICSGCYSFIEKFRQEGFDSYMSDIHEMFYQKFSIQDVYNFGFILLLHSSHILVSDKRVNWETGFLHAFWSVKKTESNYWFCIGYLSLALVASFFGRNAMSTNLINLAYKYANKFFDIHISLLLNELISYVQKELKSPSLRNYIEEIVLVEKIDPIQNEIKINDKDNLKNIDELIEELESKEVDGNYIEFVENLYEKCLDIEVSDSLFFRLQSYVDNIIEERDLIDKWKFEYLILSHIELIFKCNKINELEKYFNLNFEDDYYKKEILEKCLFLFIKHRIDIKEFGYKIEQFNGDEVIHLLKLVYHLEFETYIDFEKYLNSIDQSNKISILREFSYRRVSIEYRYIVHPDLIWKILYSLDRDDLQEYNFSFLISRFNNLKIDEFFTIYEFIKKSEESWDLLGNHFFEYLGSEDNYELSIIERYYNQVKIHIWERLYYFLMNKPQGQDQLFGFLSEKFLEIKSIIDHGFLKEDESNPVTGYTSLSVFAFLYTSHNYEDSFNYLNQAIKEDYYTSIRIIRYCIQHVDEKPVIDYIYSLLEHKDKREFALFFIEDMRLDIPPYLLEYLNENFFELNKTELLKLVEIYLYNNYELSIESIMENLPKPEITKQEEEQQEENEWEYRIGILKELFSICYNYEKNDMALKVGLKLQKEIINNYSDDVFNKFLITEVIEFDTIRSVGGIKEIVEMDEKDIIDYLRSNLEELYGTKEYEYLVNRIFSQQMNLFLQSTDPRDEFNPLLREINSLLFQHIRNQYDYSLILEYIIKIFIHIFTDNISKIGKDVIDILVMLSLYTLKSFNEELDHLHRIAIGTIESQLDSIKNAIDPSEILNLVKYLKIQGQESMAEVFLDYCMEREWTLRDVEDDDNSEIYSFIIFLNQLLEIDYNRFLSKLQYLEDIEFEEIALMYFLGNVDSRNMADKDKYLEFLNSKGNSNVQFNKAIIYCGSFLIGNLIEKFKLISPYFDEPNFILTLISLSEKIKLEGVYSIIEDMLEIPEQNLRNLINYYILPFSAINSIDSSYNFEKFRSNFLKHNFIFRDEREERNTATIKFNFWNAIFETDSEKQRVIDILLEEKDPKILKDIQLVIEDNFIYLNFENIDESKEIKDIIRLIHSNQNIERRLELLSDESKILIIQELVNFTLNNTELNFHLISESLLIFNQLSKKVQLNNLDFVKNTLTKIGKMEKGDYNSYNSEQKVIITTLSELLFQLDIWQECSEFIYKNNILYSGIFLDIFNDRMNNSISEKGKEFIEEYLLNIKSYEAIESRNKLLESLKWKLSHSDRIDDTKMLLRLISLGIDSVEDANKSSVSYMRSLILLGHKEEVRNFLSGSISKLIGKKVEC